MMKKQPGVSSTLKFSIYRILFIYFCFQVSPINPLFMKSRTLDRTNTQRSMFIPQIRLYQTSIQNHHSHQPRSIFNQSCHINLNVQPTLCTFNIKTSVFLLRITYFKMTKSILLYFKCTPIIMYFQYKGLIIHIK